MRVEEVSLLNTPGTTGSSRYARSVATNAMVGHVLGIGDRHSMNILVDCGTGEQVHIDFGIAFDQGKALQQPETVPFRLTRDVVDGLGAHGTGGVFSAVRGRRPVSTSVLRRAPRRFR